MLYIFSNYRMSWYTYTEIDILTCNVVWWVVFCGRCKCAVKIAMAAPVASREG